VQASKALAVVITAPLGVLQAPPKEPGGVAPVPDPPRIRAALGLLAVRSAIRITVWFRDSPWSNLRGIVGGMLGRKRFLLATGGPFDVWWTAHPLRWPLAVAWCGGPPPRPRTPGAGTAPSGAIASGLRAGRQVDAALRRQ